MTRPLAGRVALVAGATRGAGRAIALELALAGATVYATGRSSRQRPAAESGGHDPFDLARRPETIEETAERIGMAGGAAIGLCVDHSREVEVSALIERIQHESGRLDILVNDIWGGDQLCEWGKPLWECDVARGFQLLERALYTHIITSRHALPLMLQQQAGLVVEVTDGVGLYYRSNTFYDLAKSSVTRLAFVCAEELRDKHITALAISPGFLRSEAMLDHFGVTEATWREGIAKDEHFAYSETPRYVARGIAALAADPQRAAHSGKCYGSWQLQALYGFTDEDGAKPNWGEHAAACDFGKDQAESDQRFRAMFG
ncbi:MAG TPA: SDR family oxidoreductase [Polyangiales bacterium]|nr:SDR family oxidoreductase [Polyangiales bacterium]